MHHGGLFLESIIADAERKFGGLFNPKLLLEQLTYSGDIDDVSIEPLADAPAHPDKIIEYFRIQTDRILI